MVNLHNEQWEGLGFYLLLVKVLFITKTSIQNKKKNKMQYHFNFSEVLKDWWNLENSTVRIYSESINIQKKERET